jgi:hypothetical protein
MKKIICLLLAAASFGANAQNANTPAQNTNYVSVELDPAPFLLEGYSVSLKYSAAKLPHFTFMGSVYSSRLPDNLMGEQNRQNGWKELRLETSYALFADYFLRNDRKGFHFGASAFLYHKSAGLNETNARADFKSIYPNLRMGYVYKPFKKAGLYLNPWFNVGRETGMDDSNRLNGKTFSNDRFSYIVALHIGYQITF